MDSPFSSWLKGIFASSSDRELATNISKADTSAENDAGNPGADRNALLRDSSPQSVLPPGSTQ